MTGINSAEKFLPGLVTRAEKFTSAYGIARYSDFALTFVRGVRRHDYRSKMNELETQFEEIYLKNKWLYGSGEGSLPEHTRGYVAVLQKFLREHCITTVVDMGCGDWQFSKLMDWSGITTMGLT